MGGRLALLIVAMTPPSQQGGAGYIWGGAMKLKGPRDWCKQRGSDRADGFRVTARLPPLPGERLTGEERGNRDHRWPAHEAENNAPGATG